MVNPHGFCSGVAKAIRTIETALKTHPAPIYCYNEIVHNRQIVDGLARRGVVFVKSVAEIPRGATILFSAHGVSPEVRRRAERRNLKVIDATCPFVRKVHSEVKRYARGGFTILLIGHRNHEEVVGVAGEAPGRVAVIETEREARTVAPADFSRVAVVTQTTLSVDGTRGILDILRARFPRLQTPSRSDICYATENRQKAAQALAKVADLVLVLGSPNSSNSRRLVEVSAAAGCRTVLVSAREDLARMDLAGISHPGITSGASTPESFLREILADLAARGFKCVEELTIAKEDLRGCPPPSSLWKSVAGSRATPERQGGASVCRRAATNRCGGVRAPRASP